MSLVPKKKKVALETDEVHHGKLLRALVDWTGLTQEEFLQKPGPKWKTRIWLHNSFSHKTIAHNNLVQICKAFNIPLDYFDGKYILPMGKADEANEPSGVYKTMMDELKDENSRLKEENRKLLNDTKTLHEK